MYVNAGYLNNSRVPIKDHTTPLMVCSSGTYRLQSEPTILRTARPKGRIDFQLLYIAAGETHFYFDEKDEKNTVLPAGNMVLFRPGEKQRYVYYGQDSPEVFWVHFTGYDVTNILNYYHMERGQNVFYTGTVPEYRRLFQKMILELQMCPPLYEGMLTSLLNMIFLLIDRQMVKKPQSSGDVLDEVELAIAWFYEHYSEKISIQDYAASRHISKDWFSRSFKSVTGMTPTQYILSMRMSNAQALLEQSSYSIGQVAAAVGYNNPLYFSRVFSKTMGMSPSEYREKYKRQDDASG